MNSHNDSKKSEPDSVQPAGDAPFCAYQGDEPYIFVSYSHDDSDAVYAEIERFNMDGYNIWYDEGITSGEGWHEAVENAIMNSSLVVFFISDNAVESENVRNEVFLALDENIPVIKIFLEKSRLRHGLNMSLKTSPSIVKYMIGENDYVSAYRSLFENHGFFLNEEHYTIEERIDNPPFPAYQGDEPYIFISYSHADSELVYAELERFNRDGYNIWYDEGIPSGERWQEEVETALIESSLFVVFISRNSVASENVRNEIFSASGQIPIIPIYLEPTKLAGHGLALKLRPVQSIMKHKMSEEGYVKKYRKEFEKKGFKVKKLPDEPADSSGSGEDETLQIIRLIDENRACLSKKDLDDFSKLREYCSIARKSGDEKILHQAESGLKTILDGIYVERYLEEIENAPDIFEYPSLLLKIESDSIRYGIIRSAFLKLEKSAANGKNSDLIERGHGEIDDMEFEKLEKTVTELYRKSFNRESSNENRPSGSKEYVLLIRLKDGSELASWDDVDDGNDIVYVREDLSALSNLSGKYMDMKSLKTADVTVSDNAANMKDMFSGCSSLEDISSLKEWNTKNVTDMNGMFKGCASLKDVSALSDWDTSNVEDMNGMFDGCTSLKDISALKNWNTENVTDISGMFYGCSSLTDTFSLKNWDTCNLKFMSRAFRGCGSLKDVTALKNWNTENVTDMNALFKGCSSLTDIFSLKNWNIKSITDLSAVFWECSSLEDISALKNWKTRNVTDMTGMFKGCVSLKDISPLKDWKTDNVADMSSMFENCSSLRDIFPLKNWNTEKLKDTSRMFYGCSALSDAGAVKNWNTASVIYANQMFDENTKPPKWYKQ